MVMRSYVNLVYPEKRRVGVGMIETWFLDAVANGDIAREHRQAKTLDEMCAALEDAGIITRSGQ